MAPIEGQRQAVVVRDVPEHLEPLRRRRDRIHRRQTAVPDEDRLLPRGLVAGGHVVREDPGIQVVPGHGVAAAGLDGHVGPFGPSVGGQLGLRAERRQLDREPARAHQDEPQRADEENDKERTFHLG